jgi:multicomponent K+:H+ antiporter subunit A
MLLAPAILAGLCVLQGVLPLWLDGILLAPAVHSVIGPQPLAPVALWHGMNLPVVMSLVTLLGGAMLYAVGGSALGLRPAPQPALMIEVCRPSMLSGRGAPECFKAAT